MSCSLLLASRSQLVRNIVDVLADHADAFGWEGDHAYVIFKLPRSTFDHPRAAHVEPEDFGHGGYTERRRYRGVQRGREHPARRRRGPA